jgi:hypothetical protein
LVKRKATVQKKYGVDNVSKTKDVKDKLKITTRATATTRLAETKKTNLANCGVESTNSLQSVKDAKKVSYLKKYGVDHPLKVASIADSVSQKNSDNAEERLVVAKSTKLELYGDENYNNRDKYKETCLEKFGVENPSQDEAVHQKKIDTCMKNYGVRYPQQDPDIFRKQQQGRFTLEEYIFTSGNKIMIQGYEPIAMDMLLEEGYNETDFSFSSIPVIDFIFDGTSRKYYPDFYVPVENLLIEVKSTWTYEQHKEKNLAKQRACLEQGYNFRFMIIDGKHKLK